MAILSDEKKALLFKTLATKSSYDAGVEFELDKHYKNARTVGAAVIRIYNEVKNNPEKFAVSDDTVSLVTDAVTKRNALTVKGEARTTLREKIDESKNKSIEELTLENRSKSWMLLSLRLDDALSSKKKREKISLGEIAKVAGITFDKGQLIEGKATDHVALMAKIDGELNPQEALDMVIRMKEYNASIKEKK